MLFSISALLILASTAVYAKVIVLNKPVLYKDYPAACKKHGAEPINVRASNVDSMLNLIKKIATKQKVRKSEVKGWIASYDNSNLQGAVAAFGYAQSYDVPSLEILDADTAEAQKVKRISFCWIEEEAKKAPVQEAQVTNDLHVNTTSPDGEEPNISETRKNKSRHRNLKSKKSHKESSSRSDDDTSSGSEEASSDSEPKKQRRQKGRHNRNNVH